MEPHQAQICAQETGILDGALIVNKPSGWTSHDVVAKLRQLSRERSIGHLGTLDPAATGVLPLLLGRLTRLAQYFQGREKEYLGSVRFGFATDTYDAQGSPTGPESERAPTLEEIESVLPRFRGAIEQTPPPFSAKKVNGIRAYTLARRQQPPVLTPKTVEVRTLETVGYAAPVMELRIVCSSGTYVRALAHDLGQAVGMGAHLERLERVRVGEFGLAASYTLEQLAEMAATQRLEHALVPPTELLPEFPAVTASPAAEASLLQGRAVNLAEFTTAPMVRIFARRCGQSPSLLGLGRRIAGTLFHPQLVFPN